MRGKIILGASLLCMVGVSWFALSALFKNEILKIPEDGLKLELPERTFKMIDSDGEPIRISLGQVNHKRAVVEILLGENNLKKSDIKEGEEIQFTYENNVYVLHLDNIKAKVIGEEKAFFTLTKKGSSNKVKEEKSVSEFIGLIEKEEFEVLKKEKPFPKHRFLRKLKHKSKRQITVDELIVKAENNFSKITIKQNGKILSVAEWLKTKK